MKIFSSPAVAGSLIFTLAACGGSSTTDQVSRDILDPDALNIGTESTTESATGLPFAIDFNPETDEISGAIPVRLVRFETDYDSGVTRIAISEEVLTIPEGTEDFSGFFTYKGETVTLVENLDGNEGELSNGQTLNGFLELLGGFSQAVNIYTYADDEIGFDSDGYFILGLETNPADLPDTAGITTYSSDFIGWGNIVTSDGTVFAQGAIIEGLIELNVDFSDGGVNGSLDFISGIDEDILSATLLLDGTTLAGNGFSTTATTVVDCVTCSSSSQIGGAFFGPEADELSGIAGIDYTDTRGEEDLRLVGAGAYIATVAPE